MKLRSILAAASAIASATYVAVAIPGPGAEPVTRAQMVALADPDNGDWVDCAGEEPERREAVETLMNAVASRLPDVDWAGVPPEGAMADLRQVLIAWTVNHSTDLFMHRLDTGLAFSRDPTIKRLSTFAGWGFVEEPEAGWSACEDADLFQAMLDAQVGSGLALAAIDLETIAVGLGVTANMRTDEWPHSGMEMSKCAFESPEGAIPDWESMEDTPRSLHVRLRVLLEDGRVGHVRLNYLYDDRTSLWVPAGACSSMYGHGQIAIWCAAN